MAGEPQDKDVSLWEKVSDSVVKGLKTGKDEIVRTSKMGKIRLEISSIKSRIGDKQKELGGQVYNLWVAKQVSIAELEGMFDEIKQLEDEIKAKETEIENLVEEKGTHPITGEKPSEPTTKEAKPPLDAKQEQTVAEEKIEESVAKPNTTKKTSTKKNNAEGSAAETKADQDKVKLE